MESRPVHGRWEAEQGRALAAGVAPLGAHMGLETVVFCGFTNQEQTTIRNLVEQGL